MKEAKITGIILTSFPIFEKDKLVEIFSEEWGKVKLLAKYANTSSFRFGGKLDSGQYVSCQLYRAKTFHIVTQCDLIEVFSGIRNSFNALSLAGYAVSVIRHLTVFNQVNVPLFVALHAFLKKLNVTSEDIHAAKSEFHAAILQAEGLHSDKHPSDREFKRIFEMYSDKQLPDPVLLTR